MRLAARWVNTLVESVLMVKLLLLWVLLLQASAVVVRAEHHLELLGETHVVPLLQSQRERNLHFLLLVEDLPLEMGDVVVLAEHAVEGLLSLLEHVRALGVALLLQLKEASEDVLDVLKDLEMKLDQVAVEVDLLDPWEYRFHELLLLLVVRVVQELEVHDHWQLLGLDPMEDFLLDVPTAVLIVASAGLSTRALLLQIADFSIFLRRNFRGFQRISVVLVVGKEFPASWLLEYEQVPVKVEELEDLVCVAQHAGHSILTHLADLEGIMVIAEAELVQDLVGQEDP